LEEDYSWGQYWNYLRRQVYVMDTYCSPLNRQINHTMMLLHSYLSLAFVMPAITGAASHIFLLPDYHLILFGMKMYAWHATNARTCNELSNNLQIAWKFRSLPITTGGIFYHCPMRHQ
jgi:hypothetical protein